MAKILKIYQYRVSTGAASKYVYNLNRKLKLITITLFLLAFCSSSFADEDTIGTIFRNVRGIFGSLVNLLFGIATLAGLSFSIAALLKFKQHKDNPAQVTIGQPIGLFLLGAIMLWLPFIIQSIGITILGHGNLKNSQSTIDSGASSTSTGFGKYLIPDNNQPPSN